MSSISADELFDLMTAANNTANIKKWMATEDLVNRVTDRAKKGRAFCCVSAPVDMDIETSWDDIKEQLADVFPNCWFHYQHIYHGEVDTKDPEEIGLYILIGWDKKGKAFVDRIEYIYQRETFVTLDDKDFAVYFH
jgi:hypothetical protein